MSELLREYQILLEHHRRNPDCEQTYRLFAETRTRVMMEWLWHDMGGWL